MGGLWAALAGARGAAKAGRREAPPGKFATWRFRAAAGWLLTLLSPPVASDSLLPLEHLIVQKVVAIKPSSAALICVDASPWGAGGALKLNGKFVSYFSFAWTAEHERSLRFTIGDSAAMTTLEFYTIFI